MGDRANLCTQLRFEWNGVEWTIDYVAVPVGATNYRGRTIIVEARRDGEKLGAEEIHANLEGMEGRLEAKASYWAKRALFGKDHELLKVVGQMPPRRDSGKEERTPDHSDPAQHGDSL